MRIHRLILLGCAVITVSAQSGGNGTAASSSSLTGTVSALAALFGGGGATSLASTSYAGAPASTTGSINTRATAQRGSRPTVPSNTEDCVRQAFNLQAGACSYVSRQVVQGNEEAPGILTATCDDIVRVWTATENLPTHNCCSDLVRFIEDGCTCNQQVLSLAQSLGGVNPNTIAATARKAQVSCGRGQIYDPCTAGFGC